MANGSVGDLSGWVLLYYITGKLYSKTPVLETTAFRDHLSWETIHAWHKDIHSRIGVVLKDHHDSPYKQGLSRQVVFWQNFVVLQDRWSLQTGFTVAALMRPVTRDHLSWKAMLFSWQNGWCFKTPSTVLHEHFIKDNHIVTHKNTYCYSELGKCCYLKTHPNVWCFLIRT